MNKIFLSLLLLTLTLFGKLTNEYVSQEMLTKKIPIVDIRTPGEWRETGLLKGAIPIMFFNEKGEYNIPKFLEELNAKVDTKKPFALICRTGSRTGMVSQFLSQKLHYQVINLRGGMMYANGKNLPITPYR